MGYEAPISEGFRKSRCPPTVRHTSESNVIYVSRSWPLFVIQELSDAYKCCTRGLHYDRRGRAADVYFIILHSLHRNTPGWVNTVPGFDDSDTACLYVSGAAGDNLGAAYLLCVVYVVGSLIRPGL